MPQLAENLILKVVSEIHDPVTTTDELIPSGETSSFRSNPLGLAEFTLSRKDPAYVGRAKEVQVAEKAIQEGNCPAEALPELKPVFAAIHTQYPCLLYTSCNDKILNLTYGNLSDHICIVAASFRNQNILHILVVIYFKIMIFLYNLAVRSG